MITYSIHLKHMMDAASHIEKPDAYLYKKIVAFVKAVKKRKYKFRAVWGKVFSFMYAAKFAKTLPYYDRYPLVLVTKLNRKKGYFDGLNLHYINPYYRTILLKGINHLHLPGQDRYLTREFQDAVSKFIKRVFRPCYHRYRIDCVRNMRYLPISGLLPIHFDKIKDQTFMKSSLQRVWTDSVKKITHGSRAKLQAEARRRAKKTAKRHMEERIKAQKSSNKVKPSYGSPSRKSQTAKNSKARTGKKYKGKGK